MLEESTGIEGGSDLLFCMAFRIHLVEEFGTKRIASGLCIPSGVWVNFLVQFYVLEEDSGGINHRYPYYAQLKDNICPLISYRSWSHVILLWLLIRVGNRRSASCLPAQGP